MLVKLVNMAKSKHIHKYFKVNGTNHKIFKCDLDNCSFFIHPGLFGTLIGKVSHCNKCNEHFRMTELSINEDLPICDDCRLNIAIKNLNKNNEEIIDEVTINDLDDFLEIKGL